MGVYDLGRRMDVDRADAITEAIQAHNKSGSYDLTTPVGLLLKKYGKERMKWVLGKHITARQTGFLNDNLLWVRVCMTEETGSGDELPTFTIRTHYAVLETFVNAFRAKINKKPSFTERMKDAKRKCETHNNTSG
jgi:hypothetical protein